LRDWDAPQIDAEDRRGSPRRGRQGRGLARVLWGIIIFLVVVAAGLGVSFFTGAISTAQPTAQVPTPTPRPSNNAGQQAPANQGAGQAAQAGAAGQQAAPPKPIVTKNATYGDWIYACLKRTEADTTSVCSITQQLSDSKTKAPLLMWRITKTDKGLVGEWQTRTGIMIDRGFVLDTGGPKPIALPFQLCTPSGCQVVANLAADFIDALAKAEKANATVYPIGGKGITLAFSVKGLPDALAALKQ
jgi:invasion protein IalB